MEKLAELKKDRIEIIDVLRGFALLGIIIVHFTNQYYAGQPARSVAGFEAKNIADNIVLGFTGIFVQGKFYMIFSFLFGLSFFIQLDKSNGSPFLLRFAWRLMVLFGIGFLHHLHYRGDILTIYALLGFGLLLLNRLPDRALLVLALLLVFDTPSLGTRLYEAAFGGGNPFNLTDQKQLQLYYNTLKSGPYLSILKANFHEFGFKFDFQVSSGRIYITLGLFLLGLYAGRKKFFENWENQIAWTKKLGKAALWTIVGCLVYMGVIFGGIALLRLRVNDELGWAIAGVAYDAFNACLATLYVVGILLLFRKDKWRPRLMQLYALGRMGLTTYLMQTLFGVFVFFSLGLGLLGDTGALVNLLIGLAVYVFQIFFSQWWLKNFRFGPAEWLWRSLTYFKIQPMK